VTCPCVDLRSYGDRYRVRNEAEGRRARDRDDPWDLVLPGARGFVAPWGGATLVACTNAAATTRRVLAPAPGAVVAQDGADGQNVTFGAAHLDTVAPVLRLYRRRRLSAEHRAKLAGATAPYRFKPVSTGAVSSAAAPSAAEGGCKTPRGRLCRRSPLLFAPRGRQWPGHPSSTSRSRPASASPGDAAPTAEDVAASLRETFDARADWWG